MTSPPGTESAASAADPALSSIQSAPSQASQTAQPAAEAKSPYPPAAATPVLIGPEGIRFDFNLGCRVLLPARTSGKWRVRLRDLDTGNILFESENKGAFVNSAKRWYVRFRVEIWDIAEEPGAEPRPVMTHDYDPLHQDVLIQFPVGTLGDILAWFPYAARFADKFAQCRVTCAMSGLIIPLLRDAYPHLRLVTHEEAVEYKLADTM